MSKPPASSCRLHLYSLKQHEQKHAANGKDRGGFNQVTHPNFPEKTTMRYVPSVSMEEAGLVTSTVTFGV